MIRQILAQPLVPGFIDRANRAQLRIRATTRINQRRHSQIDAGQVGICAEMLPNHHCAFRLQLPKRAVGLFSFDLRAP
jgi:hypothetical protein